MVDVVAPFLGALFLVTGSSKLANLSDLHGALVGYRLFPARALPLLAPAVAVAELLAGAAALASPWPRIGLIVCLSMLSGFTLVALTALMRGLSTRCGCMTRGSSDDQLSWWVPVRNAFFIGAGCAALLVPGTGARGPGAAIGVLGCILYLTLENSLSTLKRSSSLIAESRGLVDVVD
jgi:hypothetical protein